ncbi:glucan endo-1,3-beta-glucosidase 4-like [Momordica charantia]|uniref:glucan endo-1,3-beta-D-glucosidase n=1 Tax=Momordica charantia TaxID=3673 RepID=A0A6J1DJY8_MOMCH|nr:glucan endo-1,3-beta-glucosidase 4-like [Momordica charantia]XP_022153733.1 glucan endo-1,3-beta-glucosidase 4-like [Momordica charantia]XP_022153734.1 glucan endo-1,3-beta-glucosidase 4-like [Momordica charantia]XP_022153735.1 glucan endo-1,3-beta-glucosidase 4-like [Momordica charantia]XP_022153736.1 glucan endo-1,3-beta-glucosidase 4-like [Momordica charantia]XP_022153737.1 glucan endo-1,3-beta-glucosidase 4-like [Momordica charantia]XP_022153739.1 glucan endo-1,3-beta-glucosidase 4-lik
MFEVNMLVDWMHEKWSGIVLFLVSSTIFHVRGAFVGINIGTHVSNLPPASNVVSMLKSYQITHVRLYDANAELLKAFANSRTEVIVGVTNEEVLKIGRSPSAAATWVNKNVALYVPATNITAIAVGSEVLTTIPNAAPVLIRAMKYLHKALVAANLNLQVKVSTPQSMDVIISSFPPSTATFNSSWNSTIYQLLQFLKNTKSYYMLNVYPYYGYIKGNGIFPLDYALFRPLSINRQIVDPNTLLHYNSMFDAMLDATYHSIKSLNFNGIPIVVTETGWPWSGGANEPYATKQNAEMYVNNLISRVLNGSGPPSEPTIPVNTYIYELFSEDQKPGPISGKNWGVFSTEGSAMYRLSLISSSVTGSSSVLYCVAKDGADPGKLQNGLNWACGQGGANCSAIQPGEPCFLPNNIKSHASYAYNDYYQKMQRNGGTCDFDGTATTTNIDPSHGSCVYTGSSNPSGGNGGSPPAPSVTPVPGPSSDIPGASSKVEAWQFLFLLSPMLLSALT